MPADTPPTVWRVTRPAAEVLVAAGSEDQAKAIADGKFYSEASFGEDSYEAVDTGEEVPLMAGVPTYAEMLATVEKRGDAESALLAKYGFLLEPLGDDGDIYLAHGHVPPDRFLEAWREWARAVWGLTQQDIDDFGPTAGDVFHRHFILEDRPDRDEGPCYRWVTPATPGSGPCTICEN